MVTTPTVGSEVAGYLIEGVLGEGGMSVVYRARRVADRAPVALKLLAPELAKSESFRDRFLKESRVVTGLDHPNIVPIYEAGQSEGTFFIAMRLVEGPDLKHVIEMEGELDVDRTLGILRQTAAALDAAHARGMIHRDVKPQNILLERDPTTAAETAFLCDFGLIKHATSHSRLTQTGELVGSTHYMAPEQIEGRADVDRRVDVYALGCVLYECLTGKVPFEKETEVAVLWAHMNSTPPTVTSKRRDLPKGVDVVVETALSKIAYERFASCGELIAAFEQEASGVTTKSLVKRRPGSMVRAEKDLWAKGPSSPRLAVKVSSQSDTTSSTAGWLLGAIGIAAAVFALLFAARDTPAVNALTDLVTGTDESPASDVAEDADRSGRNDTRTADERRSNDARRDRRRNGSRQGERQGTGTGSVAGSEEDDSAPPPAGGGARADSVALAAPVSGAYTYAQSGYQQECNANLGTCNGYDRPPGTHNVQITRRFLSDERVEVTTRSAMTGRWNLMTVHEYTRAGAVLTRVQMEMETDQSTSYDLVPDPPLEYLRYPTSRDQRWTVEWDDGDDAGDFRVDVVGNDSVKVGGDNRRATRVDTRLTWGSRGLLELKEWIDPRSKTVLKTVGTVRGGPDQSYYLFSFTSTLRSGPGF